ncbi:hypothetical protein JOQ06_018366, partial [Pogonophryne albipinna]
MTTDSGSNMIKALKDNAWPNLQCFGHRLHNAIENGVKDPRIDRAIGLITESPTRWGSRQRMIERFLEQEKALVRVLVSYSQRRKTQSSRKTIKGKVMRYLDDKYSDSVKDELLDMSSLVDPRFRTTYIDPDKVEPVKKRAVAEMMSLPAPANNSTPQQPGTAVQ